MNVLIYSDLQATEGHERLRSNPTVPLQRWRVAKAFEQMAGIAATYNCKAVWELGDLTDDRNAIPIATLNVLEAGLAQLMKGREGHSIKLIGNHEQMLRSPQFNSGSIARPFFGSVVNEAELIEYPDVTILASSYADDNYRRLDEIEGLVQRADTSKPIVLLAHASVVGQSTGHSTLEEGFPRNLFKSFDLAFLGHIHIGGPITSNAFYVGSPFQQDFGEETEEPKGVIIFNTKDLTWFRVPLTDFPRYRRLTVDQFAMESGESEDRFRVEVDSALKAQEFYETANSNMGEPVFLASSRPIPGMVQGSLSDVQHCMQSYLTANPPASKGLMTSPEDMLSYGQLILEQANAG